MTIMDYYSTAEFNFTDLSQETPSAFLWDDSALIALVTCLIILLSVSSISKCCIIYYLVVYAPSRPINTMMLIDQICQLLTSTTFGCLTIASLIRKTPIIEDMGAMGCWFFWVNIVIHKLSLALGGLGMAIFRFRCVKLMYSTVAQVWRLLKNILLLEGLIVLAYLTAFFTLGYQLDSNTPVPFCRGYEINMRDIIRKYQTDENVVFHAQIMKIVFGVALFPLTILIPFVELCIYINLFYHISKNDQKTKKLGLLPKETIFQRRKRNIITLSGQTFTFVIECGYGFIVLYLAIFEFLDNDLSLQPSITIAMSAAMSIAHFWACPELRRFYFPSIPRIRMPGIPAMPSIRGFPCYSSSQQGCKASQANIGNKPDPIQPLQDADHIETIETGTKFITKCPLEVTSVYILMTSEA